MPFWFVFMAVCVFVLASHGAGAAETCTLKNHDLCGIWEPGGKSTQAAGNLTIMGTPERTQFVYSENMYEAMTCSVLDDAESLEGPYSIFKCRRTNIDSSSDFYNDPSPYFVRVHLVPNISAKFLNECCGVPLPEKVETFTIYIHTSQSLMCLTADLNLGEQSYDPLLTYYRCNSSGLSFGSYSRIVK